MNFRLQKKTFESIFKEKEISTINYLKNCGFSQKVIDNFFKPFFNGIFLETDLVTSSRMFEFVFKMFGKGLAVIPKKGMQEIIKDVPIRRMGNPEEVARLVLWLASDENTFMTGQNIAVDGGFSRV